MRARTCSWRHTELAELLRAQPREAGDGGVVFVAGDAGSGRSDLLRDAARGYEAAERPPLVLGGAFVDGGYSAWEEVASIAPGALEAVTGVLSLSAPLLPILGLVGQAISASQKAWRFVADLQAHGDRRELPGLLPPLLRAAAEERPLVCLVDDAGDAGSGWWADLLLTFGQEIAAELPLLLVLAIDGPADLGEHDPDESEVLYAARRLHARGLARWLPLRPLDERELATCAGPAEPAALTALHEVTGGRAGWARRLWADWQRRGVLVRRDDGRWALPSERRGQALAPVRDLLATRLERLAGTTDLAALERLRTLLAFAALEGRTFTAEAVALALGRPRDETIDLLDDVLSTDAGPDGLVFEVGGVDVVGASGPRRLWRYRFRSTLDWLTLRGYGLADGERPAAAEALAAALIQLHGVGTERVARSLADLLGIAGEPADAAHYRRVADLGLDRDVILWRARRLRAAPPALDDVPGRRRAVRLLIAAAEILIGLGPLDEALACAETAAAQASEDAHRARATFLMAVAESRRGNLESARGTLAKTLRAFRALRDRNGEADALHELAAVDLQAGRWAEARAGGEQARTIFREIGVREGEAVTTTHLASVSSLMHEFDRARAELQLALKLYERLDNPNGVMYVRSELADVERLQGNRRQARQQLERVHEMASELGDRQFELGARHNLADIDLQEGHVEQAIAELRRLLPLYREYDDATGVAHTTYTLADATWESGAHEEAHRLALDALARHRANGDRYGQAHTLELLARFRAAKGDRDGARSWLAEAVHLHKQIGDKLSLARTRAAMVQLGGDRA
ncbi:MAG TPA: tetratricopeptide repeat protein [Conexibacter sp.]|nr:tetratricopeptide repeat protein [Conexibacter sp.]